MAITHSLHGSRCRATAQQSWGVRAKLYGRVASHAFAQSGELVAHVGGHSTAEARQAIDTAHNAFLAWRNVPAPSRGELVRLLGDELRTHKEALGRLVSIEVGKIISEQGRRSGAIQV